LLEPSSLADPSALVAQNWMAVLRGYREPDHVRSILEIAVTALPLVILFAAAWAALSVGVWLSLLITVPAAGFLLRLFAIQHDCGHGAFFRSRAANDWVGRVIGVFTLTPYDVWRTNHAVHHADSGNLDRRGVGDIDTLTVEEFARAPRWRRLAYRLYRNPLVLFLIGPWFVFLLQQRLPVGMIRQGWRPWLSTMATNAALAALVALLIGLMGVSAFLIVCLPIVALATSVGVWLFYIQHQFEDAYWADAESWTHQDAALLGSSYYDLPGILRWFTANIGVHHVHHLYSRIPYYRLYQLLEDHPELATMRRITLRESLACVRFKLWDERSRRMVTFRQASALASRAGA
jgi:omega-6 fatty acid desaturase (delta-12 desaturase)